ncbi:MAG: transcriptional initiation protein Tat [Saprospiraceae bacterium]|nr:MAG: transcriptional initiation protein Tat [Saprospiraceae bacterium]
MNKRIFLKTLGKGALSTLTVPLWTACDTEQAPNTPKMISGMPSRWMWIRPELGQPDDYWKGVFGKMAENGIEAVLPQIFNSHYALFDLPGFPVKERLLERLIPLAHAAGLQIHAWMWTMPCNAEEIIQNHPDWYAVNGLGEPAHTHPAYVDYYKFLCPRHPEVIEFLENRVEALAKIEDLDGIHLDYIRLPDVILAEGLQPKYDLVQDREYPQFDYCYNDICREQFQAEGGDDPLKMEDPSQDVAWREFRQASITNLVNDHLVPIARQHQKKITAAVFPNWESVRQAWHQWDLDGFLPMLYHGFYNASIDWIKTETENALERLNGSKPVYSGLFMPQLSPEEFPKAIAEAKAGGAKGFALFAYNELSEQHWQILKQLNVKK